MPVKNFGWFLILQFHGWNSAHGVIRITREGLSIKKLHTTNLDNFPRSTYPFPSVQSRVATGDSYSMSAFTVCMYCTVWWKLSAGRKPARRRREMWGTSRKPARRGREEGCTSQVPARRKFGAFWVLVFMCIIYISPFYLAILYKISEFSLVHISEVLFGRSFL